VQNQPTNNEQPSAKDRLRDEGREGYERIWLATLVSYMLFFL